MSRQAAYDLRARDLELAQQWEAAVDEGTDRLEDVALDRAINGYQQPVFQRGELVGHETVVSDTLLIFLLKGRRPEKFRDRVDLANSDGSFAAFGEAMRRLELESSSSKPEQVKH